MKIVRYPDEMKNLCATHRMAGSTIGLVPTMGALHEGHLSLLDRCKEHCDIRVMSIFVNPLQFGPAEDLAAYPRPFEADCGKAERGGCDIVFAPSPTDMYPARHATYVSVEGITGRLCGASRPNHFRGVTTVVLKFLNIVSPHVAVFGQKDAQQAIVIKRMVRDLFCPVRILVAPTVRESGGLAMSSRNAYLTAAERAEAALVYKGLSAAARLYGEGERSAKRLKGAVEGIYATARLFSVEYVEIADTATLTPLEELRGPALIAAAVRTKETKTRLIDNIVLGGEL
jgi:pantoate--beta-alanine ligase